MPVLPSGCRVRRGAMVWALCWGLCGGLGWCVTPVFAQAPADAAAEGAPDKPAATIADVLTPADLEGTVALNKSGSVRLDKTRKRVLVLAEVCLRQGGLEMLACRKRSKEHESILAIDADAFVIHTALLALKAAPGGPAVYQPEFRPPHGQTVSIELMWKDPEGQRQSAPAQAWVRETLNRFWVRPLERLPAGVSLAEDSSLRYDRKQRDLLWYGPMSDKERQAFLAMSKDKAWTAAIEYFHERGQPRGLKAEWVFVGSILAVDETTGQKTYAAEEGQYICVSNFAESMLDLALASSKEAAELSFEAWTERIPAKGTPVVIVLKPVAAKAAPATPATDKPKAEKPEVEKPADPARKKPAPETAIKD
ncbi:MAG: YdjY domain-containing protein [Planctomycetaceae bacterium]